MPVDQISYQLRDHEGKLIAVQTTPILTRETPTSVHMKFHYPIAVREIEVSFLPAKDAAPFEVRGERTRTYHCADPCCPGRPYKAADHPHRGCSP